jgi:hypothetical protein
MTTSSVPSAELIELIQAGPVLEFPGFVMADGPIVSPPPACAEVEEPSFVLEHQKPRCLRYARIGARVVVRRKEAVLAEGVDYFIDRVRGILAGPKGSERTKVSVAYEATCERVDYVVADGAGRLKLLRGADVPRLAQQFEPAVDPYRSMFRIYRTAAGCDMQPVHLFDGPVRLGQEQAYAAAIQRSRDCLADFKRTRLVPGAHLRWGLYGESTTALGVTALAELNRCPNIHRDLDYFFKNYDEAALANVPRYLFRELYPLDVPALTATGYLDADGADSYGRRHVKVTPHWHLIEWIKARFGVDNAVRNWAIGGPRSTAEINGNGLMNMSHPERLAAILDDGLDVVNIAAGMTEWGAPYTYDNVMHMGSEFRKRGTEVILFCPSRAHPLKRRLDDWRKTCDDIERAARDLGCACVQARLGFEDEALQGWLSPNELAAANANNHAGVKELAVAGRLAIDLFR